MKSNKIIESNKQQLKEDFDYILNNQIILLVDDMEFNLLTMEQIFQSYGFKNIITAKNGIEAVTKVQEYSPNLIITDIVMPELDGYEFCKKVREFKEFSQVPIIIQTSLTIPEERNKAFSCGATDFIAKPIDEDELIARSLVHLKSDLLYSKIEKANYVYAKELDNARMMQELLMPSKDYIDEMEKEYDIKILSYFNPSFNVGGDFWGTAKISENKFAIYNVDFSGHGVTAALNTFRLHTIINSIDRTNLSPAKYLEILNNQLYKLLSVEHFATMFYGIVDIKKNKLYFATAASPDVIILQNKLSKNIILDCTGFPLAVTENAKYEDREIDFNKNDLLLLFSDALIETEDKSGGFLTSKDIIKILKKSSISKDYPQNSIDDLINIFNKNYKDRLEDDLTISIYYRKS